MNFDDDMVCFIILFGMKKYFFQLANEVTFVNKGNLILHLTDIADDSEVVFDGSNSVSIDIDVLERYYLDPRFDFDFDDAIRCHRSSCGLHDFG